MAADHQVADAHLKYLDFFRLIVLKATTYVASLYEYAKESSGPLKPGVDTVEGTVRTVVGPVYKQFQNKPAEVLQFVDSKVDSVVSLFDELFPEILRQATQKVYEVAGQAPDAARSVLADIKEQGVFGAARTYYVKYEPVAEEWSYKAFQIFLTLPFAPLVTYVAAPPALFGADKFNCVVLSLKDYHVPLSDYIPLVPVERLEQVIRKELSFASKGAYVVGGANANGGETTETSAAEKPVAVAKSSGEGAE